VKTAERVIKVFEVSEDEWIAAETPEAAAAFYRKLVGEATYQEVTEEFGEPVELSPEVLAHLKFSDDEVPPNVRTFGTRLQELTDNPNEEFPQFFATVNL
jgi:hypothetical protein